MNFRKIFTNNTIIWLLIIFFLIIVFYNYKRNTVLYEGLNESTSDELLDANQFKIQNTENVSPNDALNILTADTAKLQEHVDNYMETEEYEPVNNDADVKKAISILKNGMNKFESRYSKLYFIASTVPTLFSPFVYDNTNLACQYNALLKCYPNIIKDGMDYKAMYTIIILAQIANDIINSELNPTVKPNTGIKSRKDPKQTVGPSKGTDYYGYITDPILNEINLQLDYFHNKL